MATSPNFTNAPRLGMVQVSSANTNRDGTGTLVTVLSAGSNGSRIDWIEIAAIGSTTANVLRFYVSDGTTNWLIDEVLVPAIAPSTTVKVFKQTLIFSMPLVLPNGWSLRASTNNAETYNIFAFGGNF